MASHGALQYFSAEYEPATLDQRRAPRAPVSLDAKVGRGGLGRALGKVIDLSRRGARLQTYSAMRPGMVIWLTLPRIGPVAAIIRRADDFEAGCEFRTPLTPAAYEALLAG